MTITNTQRNYTHEYSRNIILMDKILKTAAFGDNSFLKKRILRGMSKHLQKNHNKAMKIYQDSPMRMLMEGCGYLVNIRIFDNAPFLTCTVEIVKTEKKLA